MNYFKRISFLFVLTLVFVGCEKTNWNENFREYSKDPFGTYILHEEAEELFNDNDVVYLKKNIYDHFYDVYYQDEGNFANYIAIKHNAVKLDKESITRLLEFVDAGNEAFLSLNFFPAHLKEALNFDTENLDSNVYGVKGLKALEGKLYLYPNDDNFSKGEYEFDRNIRRHHFSQFDSQHTVVLGSQDIEGEKLPNFIKINYGNGAVYLHSQPIVFTNYYLLKDQKEYTEHALSFLSDHTILWDPLIKYRKNTREKEDKSIFKFFWQHEPLKWSLYVALFGLLLFIVFNARRKQRAIPIIEKLKNSTVDFTHTIANLYLKEDNHKNLVDKKITYFLELVRTKYLLNTRNLNSDFIEKLASKSGNKLSTTKYLINTIIGLDKKSSCTQDELMRLNTLIENFFETH